METILDIEICQKTNSVLWPKDIEEIAKKPLKALTSVPLNKNLLASETSANELGLSQLLGDIQSIICTTNDGKEDEIINIEEYKNVKFFFYKLELEPPTTETIEFDTEQLSVASHIIIPNVIYHGLWESLYYDTNIKENLLNFIESTIIFSDKKVDQNIISWNKVILLHGPPGTGKTSLCKALVQKAAIRLKNRYSAFQLVEIHSHSLFSKWFSESGKLVMKLFDEIRECVENTEALVCILIDEIESLAHARKSSINSNEPSDAIRVVNAFLTQLDRIKSYPNVIILTTSNVTEAIDLAFVDRADIKQYIGHPETRAIYKIYMTCLKELMRTELVKESPLYEYNTLEEQQVLEDIELSQNLLELSKLSGGLSGRTLRKIPFLAHALHIQARQCDLETFLKAMDKTIRKQKEDTVLTEAK